MRLRREQLALDTSVPVAFFPEEERLHEKAFELIDLVFEGIYACISAVNYENTRSLESS